MKEKMISLRQETYDLLKKLAKKEDRSMRSIVDRALREYKSTNK